MKLNKEYHLQYGLHSGILLCCISFFVSKWDRERTLQTPYSEAIGLLNAGYVPCPSCLVTMNIRPVKNCLTSCGKECYLEYQLKYPETKALTNPVTWDII